MKWRAPVLAGLVLYGCADTGPLGPTTVRRDLSAADTSNGIVPGSTVRIVSGETGRPVAGARVVIAGREHLSDGSGQLTLEELASNGVTVDIEASGFLDRQTIVRRGEQTTFELWPSESPTQLDADYTRALVYLSASLRAQGELEPLDRPSLDVGRVSIVPTGVIREDPRAMQILGDAADEMTSALGGAIVYAVGGGPRCPAGHAPGRASERVHRRRQPPGVHALLDDSTRHHPLRDRVPRHRSRSQQHDAPRARPYVRAEPLARS